MNDTGDRRDSLRKRDGNRLTGFLTSFVQRLSKRQQFLGSLRESYKVIDLGCGTGKNGLDLKRICPDIELHGVDILPEKNIPDLYRYKHVDLDSGLLPYPDGYFDAVIFTHVIEHLHSPFQLGKEISRISKRGAKIYLETPNWTSILVPSFGFHREQHNPFNFYDDPTHIRPWTLHSLFEFLVQGCGFRVLKMGSTRVWRRTPFDVLAIVVGIVRGERALVVSAFWNLYGWCIYGVGVKD